MEHNHDHETKHTPAGEARTASSTSSGTPSWLLPASILAAAILISGSLIYMSQDKVAAPLADPTDPGAAVVATAPAAEERDVILGDPNAPISIVQFEDFQCPFCGQYFTETESQLRKAYVETGKAKIVFRHFAFLGPESFASAEASECAKDQGKFWEYHDALFNAEIADGQEHNGNLNRELFVKLAQDIKLDEAAFASCYDGGTHKAFVENSAKESSSKYGVQSTPTIFVNDKKVEGAYPFSTFQGIIDELLNQ